jgi:isopenicillin N synthase-like dioxygenase
MTGPNLWPTNQQLFRKILEGYFREVRKLSIIIFKLIIENLDLDFESSF